MDYTYEMLMADERFLRSQLREYNLKSEGEQTEIKCVLRICLQLINQLRACRKILAEQMPIEKYENSIERRTKEACVRDMKKEIAEWTDIDMFWEERMKDLIKIAEKAEVK
jgi:hypothetical protein